MTSTEPATAATPQGAGPAGDDSIVKKLSTLDRYLAVWILLAMAVGLGLGRLVPGMNGALAKIEIGVTFRATDAKSAEQLMDIANRVRADVLAKTSEKYREALRMLTGK